MNMGGMNGLKTIIAIKADSKLSHIPTVMMSISSNPDLAQKAIRADASEFITKPTSFSAF
ncbi:response regulator [Dyadobacter sediminis]